MPHILPYTIGIFRQILYIYQLKVGVTLNFCCYPKFLVTNLKHDVNHCWRGFTGYIHVVYQDYVIKPKISGKISKTYPSEIQCMSVFWQTCSSVKTHFWSKITFIKVPRVLEFNFIFKLNWDKFISSTVSGLLQCPKICRNVVHHHNKLFRKSIIENKISEMFGL